MRIIPARTKPSGVLFREDFRDNKAVADNKGVIAGSPTINTGFLINGTNSNVSYYPAHRELFNGWTKMTLFMEWTQASAESANLYLMSKYTNLPSADAQVLLYEVLNTGGIVLHLGGGAANYGAFTLPSTSGRNRYFFVYNGAGSTNADKLKAYRVNADDTVTAVTLSFGGTIPATMGYSSYRPCIGGYDSNGTITGVGRATNTIKKSYIWNKALDTNEIGDFVKETTYEEIKPSNFQVWSNFNTNYVNDAGVRATDNLGSLGGVLTLGDGSTAATLPASITPRGFDFAASGRYLQLAHASLGNPSTAFTSFLVTRINTSVSNTGLMQKYGAANGYILLGSVTAGVMTVQYYFSGANNFTGTKKINDGLYHTIILTYDGVTANGYVDGELDGSGTFSASFTSTNPLYINGDAVYTGRYNTKLYGAGISHNFAATPTQVKYLDAMLRVSLNT